MDQASRFVFSGPSSWSLEQALAFAAEHGFGRVDFNADRTTNYPYSFTPERISEVRRLAEANGTRLGIHSSSGVNMAEITPAMAAGADEYLRQNFDLAAALGCDYVICHGGFHFSSDIEERIVAGVRRLQRAVWLGEARGIDVYFENHNWEPNEAEIHYLPHTVVEMRRYWGSVNSPRLKWAANIGHAELVPDRFGGFLDAFGAERIGQVRLHDTHGRYEEHLLPGQGIVDFKAEFRRLDQLGYRGPFTLDFGRPEDKVQWRDTFASWLAEVAA